MATRNGAVEHVRSPYVSYVTASRDVRTPRVRATFAAASPRTRTESSASGIIEQMEQQLGELITTVRAKAAELRQAAVKADEDAATFIALAQAFLALAAALQEAARALRASATNFDTVADVLEGAKSVIANAKAAIKAAEERADQALKQIEEVTGEAQQLITKK